MLKSKRKIIEMNEKRYFVTFVPLLCTQQFAHSIPLCGARVFRSIIYDHLFANATRFFLLSRDSFVWHCICNSRSFTLCIAVCIAPPSIQLLRKISIYFIRCIRSQIVYAIKKLNVLPLNDSFHWLCIQIIFICLYVHKQFTLYIYANA